jgi:O-antigen/teichoic acid export membrane protein
LSKQATLIGEFRKHISQTLVAKNILFFCQFLTLLFVARWFGPEVLGIVAIMNFFLILIQMVGVASLEPSFISSGVEENYLQLNKICLYTGGFFSFLFFVLVNTFFYIDSEILLIPTIFYSLALYLYVRSSLITSLLRERKKFIHYPLFETFAELTLLLFLFLTKNYFAGIVLLSIKYFLSSILKYSLLKWYFKNKISIKYLDKTREQKYEIFNGIKYFFGYQSFFNLVSHIARNIDIVIINALFEKTIVGLYDNALKLCRYPAMVVVSGFQPVIQPLVGKEKSLIPVIDAHRKLTLIVGIFSITISVIISYFSNDIINLLFGKDWAGSAEILSILAFTIAPQMLNVSAAFIQGRKQPKLLPNIGNFSLISFGLCIVSFYAYFLTIDGVLYGVVVANYLTYFYSNLLLYSRVFCLPYFYFLKLMVVLGFYFSICIYLMDAL